MKSWSQMNRERRDNKNKDESVKDQMDRINNKYVRYMCSTCKFYDGRCLKKRNLVKCAEQGLKNKE